MSTPAVVAAGAGALILWAALKGASVTGGLRQLVGGHAPSAQDVNAITGAAAAGGLAGGGGPVSAGAGAGSGIASAALRYVGSGSVYSWGGASPQGWDCSGFCNWVIGRDLGLPIPGSPGGSYSGHGPVTAQWAFAGIGISRAEVQAGDLVVWPLFHMGIAINGAQMVNCPGPNGTPAPVISPIDEAIGGPRVLRRIAFASGTSQAPGTTTAGGRG